MEKKDEVLNCLKRINNNLEKLTNYVYRETQHKKDQFLDGLAQSDVSVLLEQRLFDARILKLLEDKSFLAYKVENLNIHSQIDREELKEYTIDAAREIISEFLKQIRVSGEYTLKILTDKEEKELKRIVVAIDVNNKEYKVRKYLVDYHYLLKILSNSGLFSHLRHYTRNSHKETVHLKNRDDRYEITPGHEYEFITSTLFIKENLGKFQKEKGLVLEKNGKYGIY